MDNNDPCSEPNCCQPTPPAGKSRQRIKLLVFILVMLAAAGVGAYTLLRGSDASQAEEPASVSKASAQPASDQGVSEGAPARGTNPEAKPAHGGCDCAKNLPPEELPPCMRQAQPSCE
jgi:hypothetical protein